jgi:glycosyltransferase involved in cell wall biosynthesis
MCFDRLLVRILFATPFFFPDLRYGGSSTATYNVLRELSRRGHKITVLTTVLGNDATPKTVSRLVDGITVYYFKGHFEGLFLSQYLLRFLVNLPRHDLVHINNYRNFPSDIVSLWSQRKKIPTVVSANGSVYAYRYVPSFPFVRKILYAIHDTLFPAPVKKATIALAVSAEEAKHYRKFGVASGRIRIVPNGIDLETFRPGVPSNRLANELVSGPKVVGYVGRLDPIKGLQTLVKAFESVRNETPGSKLVLVGPDFGMKEALVSTIRKRRIEGVTFIDAVSNNRLPDIYRAMDVVVTPSFFEIFGMSALEAMACGKPVVSTRVGGVSDLIQDGHNGFLVSSGDHEALADRVNYLLQNPETARRLGENARIRALDYGIARSAELTEKAYFECISRHNS